MTESEKIFGRAGSGKTYALLKRLEKLLKAGIDPENIAMVTHTRVGAWVFEERAINEFDINRRDLLYFGTMHSLAWKLQELTPRNILTPQNISEFISEHYPRNERSVRDLEHIHLSAQDWNRYFDDHRVEAMARIDNILSGCGVTDGDVVTMEKMTGRGLDYKEWYPRDYVRSDRHGGKYKIRWGYTYDTIHPSDQANFSEKFRQFQIDNDLFSHARSLEEVYRSEKTLPCEYLLFDEFQDFSWMQYQIAKNWIRAPHVAYVVAAGDDAQCIYGFTSASPNFFLDLPGRGVHLPVTYRHGRVIIKNAQEMIDHMLTVERFAVEPAKGLPDGEVTKVYGDEWLDAFGSIGPDESVLAIASTNEWVYRIRYDITDAFPGLPFVNIEDTRKVERVYGMYNVLASLERGEEVPWIDATGERWADVRSLFSGDHRKTIPRKILYLHPQMLLSAIERKPEMTNILRFGILNEIKTGEFKFRDSYDKDLFEKDFLAVPWVGRYLINAIPDIEIIENVNEMFPDYAFPKAKKRIGTIHKAKGDEADTVILFMGVPYPAYRAATNPDVRDDILRQFYVGKTRPRTRLIEVYDYLKYPDGMYAPAPLEVVP